MKSETSCNHPQTSRDALILVDLQNDFLPHGALAVPHGDEVVRVANRLQPLFQLVIATRDWHPPQHGSFAASHPGTHPGDVIQLNGQSQVLWPVHCVQHSPGAELAPNLAPLPSRQEVLKGQDIQLDSYSGFFDNDHRRQTELDAVLRSHGVRRVFIMGLATDYCVKYTALDAVDLGYETVVVNDGCRGVELNNGDIEQALQALRDVGVTIVHSDDVKQMLAATDSISAADHNAPATEVLAETPHLQLVRRGSWDFVTRTNGTGVVAIVAVTSSDDLVLIEQFRPPLGRNVIELPAGIVGDLLTAPHESMEEAAGRELLEETGYQAQNLRCVLTAASSGGLTDETLTFVLASGLSRIHAGGGDATESITVHHVPLANADDWLRRRIDAGCLIDARVPTGIYLLLRKW